MAISDFANDARGATAIEYGLIGGIVSLAVVAGATQIGQSVLGFFQLVITGLSNTP